MSDGPAHDRRANRLIDEKSPYLLQHAYNPVDWHPWGEEAFEKARREDKPVFLSIGYSTCHWCHVMERESFESEEIAAIMNERFVPVKVDREERPDVDRVYMSTVQALTGQGGWPLSVWLTPDLKPFYGGTYYPPKGQSGRPGFADVLLGLDRSWRDERERVIESGVEIHKALLEQARLFEAPADYSIAANRPSLEAALRKGYEQFRGSYDRELAGFSPAPKFPRPAVLNFMLRYWSRTGEEDALAMTLETLRRMWAGGMYDHLGGGFHRYSVDAYWRVPHFEKMLYDQAQLAVSYLEAYQISGEKFFADVAREVLDYVLRDMTDSAGGFYSAEDADSAGDPSRPHEKVEGAFYLWQMSELEEILGDDAMIVLDRFGVSDVGNTISDPTGELGTGNVLYAARTPAQVAQRYKRTEAQVEETLERSKRRLLEVRGRRLRPHLDDKVITAWNGLMISALARAAGILDEPRYLEAAQAAASFVATELHDEATGTLLRRYREGEARFPGQLEDYSFFAQGLIDLYEADFEVRWLELAGRLTETQNRLFWDDTGGGYFDTSGEDASIIVRQREIQDGAEPSGSSIAACNLLRLSFALDRKQWFERAEKTLGAVARFLESNPHAMPQMVVALDRALDPPRQIVIAGDPEADDTRELLRVVHARFLPRSVLLLLDGAAGQQTLAREVPFYGSLQQLDGKATAYVCENYACRLPTHDGTELASQLDARSARSG